MDITNKYRIYPTGKPGSMCRHLYNWNLEEKVNVYKTHGETISYNQQLNPLLRLKKERSWFKSLHSQVLQDVLHRRDRAYDVFFRGVKQGLAAPGFTRFKKPGIWDMTAYSLYRDLPEIDSINISKIGEIKIRNHRDLLNNAKTKTLTISKETVKWFACFSTNRDLGSALGVNAF